MVLSTVAWGICQIFESAGDSSSPSSKNLCTHGHKFCYIRVLVRVHAHREPVYLSCLYYHLTIEKSIFTCSYCCFGATALPCHVAKDSELLLLKRRRVLKKLLVSKYLFWILVSSSSCCGRPIPSVWGQRNWSELKMNWNFWSFKYVNIWTGIHLKNKKQNLPKTKEKKPKQPTKKLQVNKQKPTWPLENQTT